MKKIYILATALMLTIMFSLTKSFGQTTQEEYNYITKGYKLQVENGQDMKTGYSFVDIGDWATNTGSEARNCTFKGLVRKGQTKPCAIMMIYKRTDVANGAIWYICIPSINAPEEIWNQTLEFSNSNFKDNNAMQNTIIWALMHLAAKGVAK